jgi:ABC-2 type transport system permease protein
MGAIWTITVKDLRQRLRDRSALIFGVVAPLVLAGIFSLVLGDVTTGPTDVRWLVLDEDGGEIAAGLSDGVLPEVAASLDGEVVAVTDRAAAEAEVVAGDADALVIVPEQLSTLAERSGPPAPGDVPELTFEVVGGPDGGLSVAVVDAVVTGYADEVARVQTTAAAAAMLGAEANIPDLVAAVEAPPLTLVDRSVTGRVLDPATGLAAGMAVFFLLFTVQFGVTSLLEERQAGTLARLYAAPLARGSVLVAKALTSFVLGVISMVVLMVASSLLLDADWGPPGGVLLLIVAAVIAATGLMAVIGAVARTAEQASNVSAAAAVVLGMLGGSFFPVGGGLLGRLQVITPHAWFLRGLSDLSAGASVAIAPLAAMLTIGAVTGVVAALLLRREVRA